MKNLIYILILLFSFSCKAQQKDGILLDPILKPNLTYNTTVITENNTILKYEGNDGLIENLKSKGIGYPITSNSKNIIETTMQTGLNNSRNEFSIITTYDNVVSELNGSITKLKEPNKAIEKLQGAQAFGMIDENFNITIDSIVGLKDESFRATIQQGMQNIINSIEYPKYPIRTGESFSIKTPLNMPTANGLEMNFTIINDYQLDSVYKEVAYFSIDQNIMAKTDIKDTEFVVKGQGLGRLEYDLEYQTNRYFYTELEMYSEVEVSGIKVVSDALTKSSTKIQVKMPVDNIEQ